MVGARRRRRALGRVRGQLRQLEAERPVGAGDLAALRADIAQALRHVAVVRYDAFGDMGGRLSFSAAVVDDRGDGLVVLARSTPAASRAPTPRASSAAAPTPP